LCTPVSNTDRSSVDVDLLAASLRADASDLAEFAELLARKLEAALPRYTRVERRRVGVLGPKRVRRIAVMLPRERLELLTLEGALEAHCAKVSGGIALKHETLELDEWLGRLSSALAEEAGRSQEARRALGDLLI
jgi:hypothetical protein